MLQYQLDYNDPANQMKRLKAAGLSPMLAYGGGNVTGNLTGNLPQYRQEPQEWNIDTQGIMGMLENYQDFRVKQKLVDKVQADTNATNVKVAGEAIRNSILATKDLRDSFEFGESKKQAPYNLQIKEQLAKKTAQDAINAVKTTELRDSELQTKVMQRAMIAQQIANLKVEGATKAKLLNDLQDGVWTNAPWIVTGKP